MPGRIARRGADQDVLRRGERRSALVESLGLVDGPYVAASDGTVRVRELVKLPPVADLEGNCAPTAAATITDKGCVVITGGYGGMGLTLAPNTRALRRARGFAAQRQPKASDMPADAPFDAFHCDVADAAQVEAVFAKIRREIGPCRASSTRQAWLAGAIC